MIVVLTHCDEVEPSDLKRPEDYDEEKLRHIEHAKQQFLANCARTTPKLSSQIVGVEAVSCEIYCLCRLLIHDGRCHGLGAA